jgi:hypothetical protein
MTPSSTPASECWCAESFRSWRAHTSREQALAAGRLMNLIACQQRQVVKSRAAYLAALPVGTGPLKTHVSTRLQKLRAVEVTQACVGLLGMQV